MNKCLVCSKQAHFNTLSIALQRLTCMQHGTGGCSVKLRSIELQCIGKHWCESYERALRVFVLFWDTIILNITFIASTKLWEVDDLKNPDFCPSRYTNVERLPHLVEGGQTVWLFWSFLKCSWALRGVCAYFIHLEWDVLSLSRALGDTSDSSGWIVVLM